MFAISFHRQIGRTADGSNVSCFVGNEEKDIADRARHEFIIALGREFGDVLAHRLEVLLHKARLLDLILRIDVVDIGGERHFRVDDQFALVGEMHNDVGAIIVALLVFHVYLRVVFLPDAQARSLE